MSSERRPDVGVIGTWAAAIGGAQLDPNAAVQNARVQGAADWLTLMRELKPHTPIDPPHKAPQ